MMRMFAYLAMIAAIAAGLGVTGGNRAEAQEVAISHGISAFGELKYPADFEAFDYVYLDAPREGGIITAPTSGITTFDSFNPTIPRGDYADGVEFLFDTLMVRAYDEPDAVYGLVAESVEMPADRSYVIFRLRPEARFADGSPLTAEDVAWTIETLRDVGAPRYQVILRQIETITVSDPHTIRFDFAADAGKRDLAAFIGVVPIFSKAWYADRAFDEPSLEPPLTSGPYRIADFEPGSRIRYERREDYWAKDLPVRRGHFNFSTITFEYHSSRDLGLEFFKGGQLDLREDLTSKNWALGYDAPAVRDGQIIKETLPDGRPSGAQGWWLNTRREKLADPRVREALSYAFDFELANKQLFYGLYTRTHSPFANSDFVSEGEPTPEELALLEVHGDAAPAAAFGSVPTPPVIGGRRGLRRALGRARALLKEAGWEVDPSDGLLKNAEGEVFRLEFLGQSGDSFERIVRPYIQNLKLLGVDATYRAVDPTQYLQRRREFDFDVITARFVFQPTLGPNVRGTFHSDGADRTDSYNLSGVVSPVLDALILEMENADSRAELIAAGRAFDRVFRAGHYWVPHWYKGSHTVAYWDRFGRPQDHGKAKPPYRRAILLTWWIDPEKAARLEPVLGR